MSDPVAGLQFAAALPARRRPAEPLPARARAAIWALVVGLHGLLIAQGIALLTPNAPHDDEALAVLWIEQPPARDLAIPPMPTAPAHPQRVRPRSASVPSGGGEAVPQLLDRAEAVLAPTPARLFSADGSIRYREESGQAVGVWSDSDRILGERRTRLPGHSDAAAAEKVALRMRRAMAPADVVAAVLRFLFAAPQPDDCAKIEDRLVNDYHPVTREIDLVKFRKTCVP